MPGEFAMRGGIVDIFAFGSRRPLRVEFFGDDDELELLAEAVTAAGAATTGGETGAQNTGTEAGADKGAALTTVEAPAFAEAKVETTPAAPSSMRASEAFTTLPSAS